MTRRRRLWRLTLLLLLLLAAPGHAHAQNYGNISPQTVIANPSTTATQPARPVPFSELGIARSIMSFGARSGGSFDNAPAIFAALSWANSAAGNKLIAPAGTYFIGTAPGCIDLAPNASITIIGDGPSATIFDVAAGINPFCFNKSTTTSSYHFRDFTCATRGIPSAGSVACISIHFAQTPSPQAGAAISDITNMIFRGSDGWAQTMGWGYGFLTDYDSNINFTNNIFQGPVAGGGNGVYLFGGSDINHIGIVYNFVNNTFYNLSAGLYYGAWLQGVAITGNNNFVANTYGIYIPTGANGIAQLTVNGDQFGYNSYGIYVGSSEVGNLIVQGNLIYSSNASNIGMVMQGCIACTVSGNSFYGQTTTGTVGIDVENPINHTSMGTIFGNAFDGLGQALVLGPTANVVVSGNSFGTHNTKNIVSAGFSAQILDAPVSMAATLVTAATGNGGGLVELAVNSTASFVNDQLVSVTGVGGISVCNVQCFSYVQIDDATHLTLLNVGFGGTYTLGGVVQAVR